MKIRILTVLTLLIFTNCSAQKSKADYNERTKKIIELTEENIYDSALLKSKEWKAFEAYMASDEIEKLDGEAYVKAFNEKSNELPFSHFYMDYTGKPIKKEVGNTKQKKTPFELEEIDSLTVVLHLRKFISDATPMIPIIEEIASKKYTNLIIDLRNNSGGSLDAAVVLGRFLTANPMDAGAYITRNWYDIHDKTPTKEDIKTFPYLQDMTSEGFREIQKEVAFRMVLPGHNNPTFSGNVYVLTNRFSASACEPFVHVLKTQTNATIVGETTMGAMLSAVWFDVEENLSLFIPINDYFTAEGTRLDRIGVTPNVEVKSENALEETFQIISKS